MTHVLSPSTRRNDQFPATARLRAELFLVPDLESLVSMFVAALAEHGIDGHFCLKQAGAMFVPLVGDRPELVGQAARSLVVDTPSDMGPGTRMLLAPPAWPLTSEQLARVRGYAQLYAARAVALREAADDVETECGLTLHERFALGRLLAGLAPVDVALQSGLTVAAVSSAIDSAVEKLGAGTLAEATAFAARRGWLAVINIENCSLTCHNLTYKATQNG